MQWWAIDIVGPLPTANTPNPKPPDYKKALRPINTALSLSFEHTLQLLGEAREPLVIISYIL